MLPYIAELQKLAGELETVHLLDLHPALSSKAKAHFEKSELHSIYSDGVHFSHLGAMIIAGEVLKACEFVQDI